jgi:hypothetical protein
MSLRRSMVQVKIGRKIFDAVYEPSCRTCTHPARMLIEEKLLQNYSYRAIAELYSEQHIPGENGEEITLPRLTHQSVANHFSKGHMPLEAATIRRLAEKRANDIGAAYDEQVDRFVDHMVLAEATVARVYERMVIGDIEPDVKDGLAAAKMLADVEEKTTGGLDAEAWSEAMMIYFETAREHMDPVAWHRFTTDLAANPILRALQNRMNPDPNVIDSEPVAIGGAS